MLTRAETPSQSFVGELYFADVSARVESSTFASSPRSPSASSGGEFSVTKTSAGDFEPSWMICAASVPSSSERIATGIPVAFVNAAASADTLCGCWPL